MGVLLNLAMNAAENDTEDAINDETNAVNFSLNDVKEDDTTTESYPEENTDKSEPKNISDDSDAIDASINEMTVDINKVKEAPLSVDHAALMLNSESPPPVFLCIHLILSVIFLKLHL